jgi:hypothetical protein
MEFEIGDRVCIYDYTEFKIGLIGTIVDIRGSDVGICHDDHINGHQCNGKCRDGYGWYYHYLNLKPITFSTDTLILLL